MAKRKKTWAEKLETGEPHVDTLERDFGGMPAGTAMLISSPREVQAFLHRAVPAGTTLEIREFREQLAQEHGAAGTCPLTTSIFLRIVAEHAWDQLEAGASPADVAPFWRVIDPKSPLAKKLRAGPLWIELQRRDEAG